jgi:hypothetical protein
MDKKKKQTGRNEDRQTDRQFENYQKSFKLNGNEPSYHYESDPHSKMQWFKIALTELCTIPTEYLIADV